MGTLDRPSSGLVRVAGLEVAALGDRQLAGLRAQRIGFVFQQFFLAEHQTVVDNVADGLLYARQAWQTGVTRPPQRWNGWGSATNCAPAPPSCPVVSGSGSR